MSTEIRGNIVTGVKENGVVEMVHITITNAQATRAIRQFNKVKTALIKQSVTDNQITRRKK